MKSFKSLSLFLGLFICLISLSALASSPFIDGSSPRVFPSPSSGFPQPYDDRGLYPPIETTDIDPNVNPVGKTCYSETKILQKDSDGNVVHIWELGAEVVPCPETEAPKDTPTD